MSYRAVSIAIAFLASALLLSSSVPKVATCRPSPSHSPSPSPSPSLAPGLIGDLCGPSNKKCIATLESEPRVVAASNLLGISIAIIEAAMSNATKTRSYVKNVLKQPGLKAGYKYVLQQCDVGYKDFGASFNSALREVKHGAEGEYDMATYDIKVGYTDRIDECRNAMNSKNVNDTSISQGNDFISVFGSVAFDAVSRLSMNSTM